MTHLATSEAPGSCGSRRGAVIPPAPAPAGCDDPSCPPPFSLGSGVFAARGGAGDAAAAPEPLAAPFPPPSARGAEPLMGSDALRHAGRGHQDGGQRGGHRPALVVAELFSPDPACPFYRY